MLVNETKKDVEIKRERWCEGCKKKIILTEGAICPFCGSKDCKQVLKG